MLWNMHWLVWCRFMMFITTSNNISVNCGDQFYWRRKPEKTADLLPVTDKLYHIMLHRVHLAGVNKSPSPMPGASNFHIWASWNNQLYAWRASKNIYRILTNLSIFAYLLIFIYVICCLISSNVLFIQLLAFCRNWEQRR